MHSLELNRVSTETGDQWNNETNKYKGMEWKSPQGRVFSFLPMMGARRKMSERRLFTGSYGESSKKSLPVRKRSRCSDR